MPNGTDDLYRALATAAPPAGDAGPPGQPPKPRPGTTITATIETADEGWSATLLGPFAP